LALILPGTPELDEDSKKKGKRGRHEKKHKLSASYQERDGYDENRMRSKPGGQFGGELFKELSADKIEIARAEGKR